MKILQIAETADICLFFSIFMISLDFAVLADARLARIAPPSVSYGTPAALRTNAEAASTVLDPTRTQTGVISGRASRQLR